MKMSVGLTGNRSFNVKIRDFNVVTDLPAEKKGTNTGPTPSELFVASFSTCVALFVVSYLRTAELDPAGLTVDVDWDFSQERPSRIDRISMDISIPNARLGEREKAVLAAAKKCTVHNTLENPPSVIDIKVKGK